MNQRKLGYLPCYVGASIKPFDQLFPGGAVNVLEKGFEGLSAILLWGGTDIHPAYYGAQAHRSNDTRYYKEPSIRDKNEWKAMIYAKANHIPIIGVCRGAQFLCAFAGGSLIQDVTGHAGGHHKVTCKVDDGEEILETTSAHHQMMYPFDIKHEMLAWSTDKKSHRYDVGPDQATPEMDGKVEPEVVWFPTVKGFGIQGHPEWMSEDSSFVQWCLDSISQKFFSEKFIKELA